MDNITSVALLVIVVACVGAIMGHATPDQVVDEIFTSERPYLSCVLYFACTLVNCGLNLVLLICTVPRIAARWLHRHRRWRRWRRKAVRRILTYQSHVYAACLRSDYRAPFEEAVISDKDGVPQGADPIVMEMACDPCPSSDRWFAHLAYLCSAEACAKGSGKGADAMSRPLREGIRVNRDQNARPRGGGVDEDIYDVGESRASNHALLQGIDLPAEPPAESCLRNAVQCTRIYGNIGGALHIAANTHGDGACALHAVWGRADPERHMDLFTV